MKLSPHCHRLLRNLTDALEPIAGEHDESHDLDRGELDVHLATCAPCRRHVDNARALARVLRDVPALECPATSEHVLDGYLAEREHAFGSTLRAALSSSADHAELPATSSDLIARLPAEQTSTPAPRLGQALRAGLAPVPVPGWIWTRVRAEIAAVRSEMRSATAIVPSTPAAVPGKQVAVATALPVRRRASWLHGLLATAAAAALVVWLQRASGSPAVLRAQPIDVIEPLDAAMLPEALMRQMLERAATTPATTPAGSPGAGAPPGMPARQGEDRKK